MRITRRELLVSLAAGACVARAAPPAAPDVRVAPGVSPSVAAVEAWIANGIDTVERWYERFPVPSVRIEVGAGGKRGPHGGVTADRRCTFDDAAPLAAARRAIARIPTGP